MSVRPSLKRRRTGLRVCAEKTGNRAGDKARGDIPHLGRQSG
ncbi:hypothetical protein BLA15816_00351 [Burkholderia lata]|uniref:Uncharacterized protein n=1 Tax=Burkholderia lata (strain ATCC 17760 / DSM 23089 / LMG 22485 / NCIMB 9086 / R18194 / 383) TaxID=482957 RepID=A0A6P2H3L3_BURL3|nr:hypothetical protein BLA15816_00351 [Burkholderia lata]VWC46004.1 hypothetical protein BLA15945_07463 [Burkholderia lata]